MLLEDYVTLVVGVFVAGVVLGVVKSALAVVGSRP